MKGEIYDKKEIYDQLNKDVYFKDGGSMNLASLAGSIEKIRSKSKSSGNGSDQDDPFQKGIPMILTCFYDANLSAHYFYTPAIIYRYTTGGSGEFTVKLSTGQSATWQFIGIYSRNHSLDNSGEVLSYCQFTVPGTEGYLDTVTGQSANFEIATKHVTEERTTMFYLCALDNNEIPIAVLPIIVTALPDDDQ